MNVQTRNHTTPIAVAVAAALMIGCASTPKAPEGADTARDRLSALQSDAQLATRAPAAMREAETAMLAAEASNKDPAVAQHLLALANGKIDIAEAQAGTKLLEDQRKLLSEQQQEARLQARTREADTARRDVQSARADADTARSDTAAAQLQTEIARNDTTAAQGKAEDLQRQIAELNAEATERGLIVTLGDVQFETGQSDVRDSATDDLTKLALFLKEHDERTVQIEGHTDSTGSDDQNKILSRSRADSVRSYLVRQGVDPLRLVATGMGEGTPIAGNDSVSGRQQNRRVEVIISNPAVLRR